MSAMYLAEVPLYGGLVHIVSQVNSGRQTDSVNQDSAQRLSLKRHGAIRLGTSQELRTIKRIFHILGMQLVDYYELSVAGLPMHATCFRPTNAKSLEANPFRVFTTLLRPNLIQDDRARRIAESLLQSRNIFSAKLLQLLDQADQQSGRLTVDQVETFIPEALSCRSVRFLRVATTSK